jgi:hypothetical protein
MLLACTTLATSGLAYAATAGTDKAAFLAIPGQRIAASFEDVPAHVVAPLASGSVYFPSTVDVRNEWLGFSRQTFFGSHGTAPNFLEVLGVAPGLGLTATFSMDVVAIGFDLAPSSPDAVPNGSALDWTTRDAGGNVLESGSVPLDLSGTIVGVPRFFGLVTDRPFRTASVVMRRPGGGFYAVWFADDVRVVTATTVAVPTMSLPAMASLVLGLVLVGLWRLRAG